MSRACTYLIITRSLNRSTWERLAGRCVARAGNKYAADRGAQIVISQSGEVDDAQGECPLRILLVEDEILIRMDLAETMRARGWEVIEAGTAVNALDLLRATPFDVVVTDVHMPGGMTGLDLARIVRDGWPDLAVVVMSGLHRPQQEEGPYFDAFEIKPVANIATVIEAVLARKSS